ncbi:MAG: hypothetical protein Q7S73_01025 [bacterium]|jgi:hypothetical protein|nr:hypothetical protein [bacterium]
MKPFSKVAALVFGLITILHLARLFYGWGAVIGGWVVPMWLSWVAVLLAGLLFWGLRRESK